MGFAALIAAYHESGDGDGQLRALLPMAGRTLLENQVRRATAAGASHAVILVERVPAGLNSAIDRLRHDGIAATLARDPAEAADHFHPDDNVLLVADGLVAATDCFDAMAVRNPSVILTVMDTPEHQRFERIDAGRRWAGLALTDARTLAETAAMLGDWDLQSTLMRRIVQAGASFLPIDGELGAVPNADDAVLLAENSTNSRNAGKSMLARNRRGSEAWPENYLFAPLVSLVAPFLLDRRVEALWLRIAAIGLTISGAFAFATGWLLVGIAGVLVPGPLEAIAARIDLAQLRDRSGGKLTRIAMGIAQFLAIAGLGYWGMRSTDNIVFFHAAIVAVVVLILAQRQLALFRRMQETVPRYACWFATTEGAIWLLPLFAITGFWLFWPTAAAIYAVGSLFLLQSLMKNRFKQPD